MLNLKKTAVAVLAFGSSAVFAGTMGPVCAPGNVTVPCEATAWDFGVQALYLQPVYDADLAYVADYTTSTGVRTYSDLDPKWGWGFKLEGSYHFSTGNDFDLNWYHYSKKNNQAFAFNTAPGADLTDVAFRFKPQWDAVNFEFGQHVDFGEFKNIRFHGGAQYARIKSSSVYTARSRVTGLVLPGADSQTITYNGFGPRMGADMSYDLGNGFAVYGNAATTILVGTSKFAASSSLVGGSVDLHDVAYASGSRTAIVPELEAKLGATYTYAMASGDLTLDAAYMWLNYFNAQHGVVVSSIGESDFAMNGVFAGLKWVGNVA